MSVVTRKRTASDRIGSAISDIESALDELNSIDDDEVGEDAKVLEPLLAEVLQTDAFREIDALNPLWDLKKRIEAVMNP